MSEGGSKRAVAEIRFGEDRSAIAKVAGRSIHQYWNALSPYFRDVLLAPQRRSDDGGVSWTWREPPDNRALSATELGGVRQRLDKAAQAFADRPAGSAVGGEGVGGVNSPELFDQISVRVKSMVGSLVARSDGDLAGFVCRTETGIMVHSWGVAAPAQISHPDALESEIQGVVLVGDNGSAGHEVVLENTAGLVVVRARSDEQGAFRFPKIKPGRYRVRVLSDRMKFPAKGQAVTVERGSVTRLQLHSTTRPREADNPESGRPSSDGDTAAPQGGTSGPVGTLHSRRNRSLGPLVAGILALLLLVGGGAWFLNRGEPEGRPTKIISTGIGRAPDEPSGPVVKRPTYPVGRIGGDAGVPASVDGLGHGRVIDHVERPDIGPVAGRAMPASPGIGAGKKPMSRMEAGAAGSFGEVPVSSQPFDDAGPAESGPVADATAKSSFTGSETGSGDSMLTAHDAMPLPDNLAGQKTPPRTAKKNGAGPARTVRGAGADNAGAPAGAAAGIASSAPTKSAASHPARKGAGGSVQGEPVVSIETALPDETTVDGAVSADTVRPDGIPAAEPTVTVPSERSEASDAENDGDRVSASGGGSGSAMTSPGGALADGVSAVSPASPPSRKVPGVPARPRRSARGQEIFSPDADANNQNGETGPEATPGRADGPGGDPAASPPSDQPNGPTATGSAHATTIPAGSPSAADDGEPLPSVEVKATLRPSAPAKNRTTTKRQSAEATDQIGQTAKDKASPGGHENNTVSTASPALPEMAGAGSMDHAGSGESSAASANGSEDANAAAQGRSPEFAGISSGRVHELKTVRWKARLVRDTILPTRPVRAGEDDSVDALRRKLMDEHLARLPAALKSPVIRYGLVFQVGPAGGGAMPLRWVGGPDNTAVPGPRAELVWTEGGPRPGGLLRLLRADNTEAARVVFRSDGSCALVLAEGTRGWFWIGAETAGENDTVQSSRGPARYEWQVSGQAAKSVVWRNDDRWLDGRGIRLELTLDAKPLAGTTVALVDHLTGWSLSGGLR